MKIDRSLRAPGIRAQVLGLPVDCVTTGQAIERIEAMIDERVPRLVFTADASGLVLAQDDAEFRRIVERASLITPDSSGVVWALHRAGHPAQKRVSGVDLVGLLCERSADEGYRLYFLGGEPGVAETAAERLRLKYPGCNIVGARHGYFPSDSDEVVAHEVAESRPDILFVAMGMPRQEKFIARTQDIIKAPVAMGVGGSFDVFSGRTKRAPKIVQSLRLEWLWRLILNPKKFAKVKSLPRFVRLVLKSDR